mgnify:CR=1 FL=1
MLKIKTESNNNWMEPNLLHAARYCDFDEAKAALKNNPSCIYDYNANKMNALQVAICEFHEDMAFFLLENSKISASHTDIFDRHALNLALQIGSEELCGALNTRWCEERRAELNNPDKVTPLSPKPN